MPSVREAEDSLDSTVTGIFVSLNSALGSLVLLALNCRSTFRLPSASLGASILIYLIVEVAPIASCSATNSEPINEKP